VNPPSNCPPYCFNTFRPGTYARAERLTILAGALEDAGSAQDTLSRDDALEGAVVIERRLVQAGLRLAQFLNDTFKD
jgi:hypothetical protein